MPTSRSCLSPLLCGLLTIFCLSLPARAQTITGTISGTVTDAAGGAISGATVTIINEANAEARNATTNEEGRFNFASVQPGVYTVRVEQQGFQHGPRAEAMAHRVDVRLLLDQLAGRLELGQ